MKTYEIHAEARDAQPTAVIRATLPADDVGPWLASAYGAVAQVIAHDGTGPDGPPFVRFHKLDDGRFAIEAGFGVRTAIEPGGDVQPSELPGGLVAVTIHTGPYEEMVPAYEALASWVGDQGGELAGDPWEIYFSDPATEPDPATWRTEIVQPYRLV